MRAALVLCYLLLETLTTESSEEFDDPDYEELSVTSSSFARRCSPEVTASFQTLPTSTLSPEEACVLCQTALRTVFGHFEANVPSRRKLVHQLKHECKRHFNVCQAELRIGETQHLMFRASRCPRDVAMKAWPISIFAGSKPGALSVLSH